ncbi:MAG: GAF domain-containing protein, partial [Desulfobacteraceae bacterium]
MTLISANHLQTILEVIHSANAHLEEFNTFRTEVLEAIRNIIQIDTANFFLFDENMVPYDPVALNIAEKYLHLYTDHFHRFNHFDPTYGCIKNRPAVTDNNLLPFSVFKKSYFYNEFLKVHNVHRQMVLYLQSEQKLLGFIGVHRSDENAEFKDWELAVAEKMAPLLSQSLEKAQFFQKTKSDQVYFQAILNRTNAGVMLVGFDL